MAVSVFEKRPRQSLRLETQVWEKIDRIRTKRAGTVSRNTWITEAIIEKLTREQSVQKQERNNA